MNNKFKVGDRVKIAKSSEYYGTNDFNPSDCDGTIICRSEYLGGLAIDVQWDNGKDNSYRDCDLDLVKEKK